MNDRLPDDLQVIANLPDVAFQFVKLLGAGHFVTLEKVSIFFLLKASAEAALRGSPEAEAPRAPLHWRSDSVHFRRVR